MSYRVKPSHPILAKVDGVWQEAKWKIASGPQTKSPDGKSHKANAHITLADGKVVKVPYGDVRFLPNGMDEQAMFMLRDLNAAEQNNSNILDLATKIRGGKHRELMFGAEPPVWRSVTDTADEDEVIWENELRDAYVMVDTATGNVFTYRVALAQGIKTLADLDLLMQLNGWQLAQDAVQPPIKVYTIADRSGNEIATYIPASDQFIIHGSHDPGDPMAPHVAAKKFEAEHGDRIKDHIRKHSGETTIYLFSEEDIQAALTKPAGDEIAAEQPDDATEENNESEEAVKPNTEMLALRWDTEVLGEEKFDYRVWGRQPIKGERHYVVQTSGGNILFMPSVTTVLKASMPKPDALLAWAVDSFNSYKEYLAYMEERTGFGSVVHGVIADAINGVTGNLEDRQWWLDYLKVACARNGCPGKERKWLVDVQKSLMSVRQWADDYNARFLMVEKALYAPHTGIAGQIDFLVEMDSHIQNVKSTVKERREKPTRVLAMVDLKTGKDSDQYPAQLAMYTRMLFEGFPRIKEILAKHYPGQSTIDGDIIPCYLLFPEKGWRNKPKAAKMLDRTEKAAEYAQNQMNHHIALFKLQRPAQGGKTILKGPSGFNVPNTEAVGYKTLADIWMDKINEGELEPIEDVNEEDEAD